MTAEILFAPSLAKGTRVRVVVPGAAGQAEAPISGALLSLQGDTVTISAGWSGASRSIVLDRGWRLEVAARGDRHGEAGAAIGAAVGALAGAAIGANSRPRCPSGHICLVELSAGQRTLIGAGVGWLGGALLGFLLGRGARSEAWVPVETAGLRCSRCRSRVSARARTPRRPSIPASRGWTTSPTGRSTSPSPRIASR